MVLLQCKGVVPSPNSVEDIASSGSETTPASWLVLTLSFLFMMRAGAFVFVGVDRSCMVGFSDLMPKSKLSLLVTLSERPLKPTVVVCSTFFAGGDLF